MSTQHQTPETTTAPEQKTSTRKDTHKGVMVLGLLTLLMFLGTAAYLILIRPAIQSAPDLVSSEPPASAAAAADPSVDPLTCYIAANGSMAPVDAQLRCGDNQAVDLTITAPETDNPAVEITGGSLDGWEVTNASAGNATTGAPIVQVRITDGETRFTYTRDLSSGPETTNVDRAGTAWPATEIPTS